MDEMQKGQFLAVLVGVNHYDYGFAKLNLCVNDVKALEETLKNLGYDEVCCLHDELDNEHIPTLTNVAVKLVNLKNSFQHNDLLWVHFSCHGMWLPDKNESVLILRDSHPRLLKDSHYSLSVSQVEENMRNSGAGKLILTLDACQSGANIGRDISDPEEFIKNVHEKAKGFALLAAAAAHQNAQEEGENGIFTYFLLQGLNSPKIRGNNNFITVNQLYTYVLNELRKWGRNKGEPQFPTQRVEGVGDIILAYFRENFVKTDLQPERILILTANPKNTTHLRLDKEVREIYAVLKTAREQGQVVLEQRSAARFIDLKEALLEFKPTVIHFCGHGAMNEGLIFENETGDVDIVNAQQMSEHLKFFATQIKCVLLNTNYSQVQAQEIAKYIDYTIGYPNAFSDIDHISFSQNFYRALGTGYSFEQAYNFGIAELGDISEAQLPILNSSRLS